MKPWMALAAWGLLSVAARAEDLIVWKFKIGDRYKYTLDNKDEFRPFTSPKLPKGTRQLDGSSLVPNPPATEEVPTTGYYHQGYQITMEVIDRDHLGAATVKIRFTKVVVDARHDDTRIEAHWDSSTAKDTEDFGFWPYKALLASEFTVVVEPNGEHRELTGPTDYLDARVTKQRPPFYDQPEKEKLSPSEEASKAMPMPLPVEFWLDLIFRTIPPNGQRTKVNRDLLSTLTIKREYQGGCNGTRKFGKEVADVVHWESADRRFEKDQPAEDLIRSFTHDWRDGENVKLVMAWSLRQIDACFEAGDGYMKRVELKSTDEGIKISPYERVQTATVMMDDRKGGK